MGCFAVRKGRGANKGGNEGERNLKGYILIIFATN